jgi:hypothetical protein
MAERESHDDLAFGSDSFLDVVANIVGILIILIVVAGLRVSRTPVISNAAPVEPALADRQPSVVPEEDAAPAEPDWGAWFPPAELVPPEPAPMAVLQPPPEPTPPPDLVARAEQLRAGIATVRSRIAAAQQRRKSMSDQGSRGLPQLAGLQRALDDARDKRTELQQQSRELAAAVSTRERELSNLQAELLTRLAGGPKTEVLSHRVTPIGRVVSGPELHFRLEGNRVSVVPIDALADELKKRIERNRDSLLRMQRYEGTVGPIDGYEMRYVMRQQHSTVLEELRFGRGFVKMSVVFWELLPQRNVPTESGDEAMRRNSRFYRTLQRAGPNATITFWVLPDSFELHRTLQEFAHSAGFEVAARPLPYGVPIAGSPNGSRSVAQ